METIQINAGTSIEKAISIAKDIARQNGHPVKFTFNDIEVIVDKNTSEYLLERDYGNAHIMKWETIGPDCDFQYDADTEITLCTRLLESAKKRKADLESLEEKDNKDKEHVISVTSQITMELLPGKAKEYASYVEMNSKDGYSQAVVEYGELWAKLMQMEIAQGKSVADCADETQESLGYIGLAGFQFGCVVQALSVYWTHGEQLRKWHNKKYGIGEYTEGVVNPAILSIK